MFNIRQRRLTFGYRILREAATALAVLRLSPQRTTDLVADSFRVRGDKLG